MRGGSCRRPGEGLGGRQARGTAQPIDATLATCVGFDFEDLDQEDERLIAARVEEPLSHLIGRAGQLELAEERRDAIADLGGVVDHAAPPS